MITMWSCHHFDLVIITEEAYLKESLTRLVFTPVLFQVTSKRKLSQLLEKETLLPARSNLYHNFFLPFRNNQLAEAFRDQFPESSLHIMLADFSLPTSLSDKCHPINSPLQQVTFVDYIIILIKGMACCCTLL